MTTRVLHVLHHSVPYFDGYSVRSRSIVRFQRALGLAPIVLTSAHHELEVGRKQVTTVPPVEAHDGIAYYRTPVPNGATGRCRLGIPFLRERALMSALTRSLELTLASERVDIVHAHSPVLCGLPAFRAARKRGLPFVYEVRAFWEDAILASRQSPLESVKYRYSRRLETGLLRKADAVVAISQHMIDEIAARGIERSRLHLMPNGVDIDQFAPTTRDRALESELALQGCPTIGFIGTFFNFEGLDCLVRAMPLVLERIPAARLVLIGTGEADAAVRSLVRELGLTASILQLGRVPHQDILRYYSLMDILVYPRHRDRITELVTPLKPLEAMAMGKAVIGSDVGGIQELLDNGRAGLLFKSGNPADLARQIGALLENPERRTQLAEEGRRYAMTERRWDVLVNRYASIYESARASQRR